MDNGSTGQLNLDLLSLVVVPKDGGQRTKSQFHGGPVCLGLFRTLVKNNSVLSEDYSEVLFYSYTEFGLFKNDIDIWVEVKP